jgi:hypothetical protein
VINTSENNSKGSSSKFLLNFISIHDLIFWLIDIICLIVIKSMVINAVYRFVLWIFILACKFSFDILTNTFVFHVETSIIDGIISLTFFTFIWWQLVTIIMNEFIRSHWILCSIISLSSSLGWNLSSRNNWLFWWSWISIINFQINFMLTITMSHILCIYSLHNWRVFG